MSVSPTTSPAPPARQLAPRPTKRARASDTAAGRPLTLPRLLETLDASQLRLVLQRLCEQNPDIGQQVVAQAPRPSVGSVHEVLQAYQARLKEATPYGHTSAEYEYCRVRAPLVALVDAIADFTPQFLPPHEPQATVSLQYLDLITGMIHQLPSWDAASYRRHKDDAYDDVSRAWALVMTEAAKRGGGITLAGSGWDHKLSKHHDASGGRLSAAMEAMASINGWMAPPAAAPAQDAQSRFDMLLGGAQVSVGMSRS
jgi:hypothetical protein